MPVKDTKDIAFACTCIIQDSVGDSRQWLGDSTSGLTTKGRRKKKKREKSSQNTHKRLRSDIGQAVTN